MVICESKLIKIDMDSELIIIGSGPAGLTAAIYAARADLKPILFTGLEVGGQLMTTTIVDNFPGFPEGVMGPQLMMDMLKQAEKYGTKIVRSNVEKVELKGEIKKIWADGKEYSSRAVIIATGASPKRLYIPGEDKFYGRGVSTCATCDGAFFRDKVVAVVGGGDTAMEDSSYLTKFASKVYVIHRRDSFRASPIMQKRIIDNPKVEILWDTEVKEVLGEEKVVGVKLFNSKTSEEKVLDVDGFFLAIGHTPNTGFLEGHLPMDEHKYLEIKDNTKTDIEGVFVAGDVRDGVYRQAITASGMGCMAAMDADKWLAENK